MSITTAKELGGICKAVLELTFGQSWKQLPMEAIKVVSAVTYTGDCLDLLNWMGRGMVDLAYIDPPFFTQKVHTSVTRDGARSYSFSDVWEGKRSYEDFISERVSCVRDILKGTGSLFFHCDKTASHLIRFLLDRIMGPDNFRSEIIWSFRRWSNGKRGLLPAHQTIFFYSKTSAFKFNTLYQEYSPATNIDQVMQKRARDSRNKSVYARDKDGIIVGNAIKKGVPISDVWDIPFLNPKAKEREGFPAQKPLLLLKRIIELVTDEGDLVLDPFCGSGTTLVAAKLLNRNSVGIDTSAQAIELAKRRLENPVFTNSRLLHNGRESYHQHDAYAASHLFGIDYIPVQRNKGIDGLLKAEVDGQPVFVRVQRQDGNHSPDRCPLAKSRQEQGQLPASGGGDP